MPAQVRPTTFTGREIITTRRITANQVLTLLSDFFAYGPDAVRSAIAQANAEQWTAYPVGLRATVMAVSSNRGYRRYTVSIVADGRIGD